MAEIVEAYQIQEIVIAGTNDGNLIAFLADDPENTIDIHRNRGFIFSNNRYVGFTLRDWQDVAKDLKGVIELERDSRSEQAKQNTELLEMLRKKGVQKWK